ncbi:transposase, partial [Intestinimonas butyriciproducens]|uniref:transposase n=1 Tax=Intestinimonas butyriciproducens TaxID=1297617 RepID=UPI0019590C4C|nr:transposase [Intestinimonas butyriciproducens]
MLFKVLVHGYLCGIYSSRKLEEACQYRIDFRWLLEDRKPPDHSTLARFRTGRCKEAVEDLFYQFVRKLEEVGETDH